MISQQPKTEQEQQIFFQEVLKEHSQKKIKKIYLSGHPHVDAKLG